MFNSIFMASLYPQIKLPPFFMPPGPFYNQIFGLKITYHQLFFPQVYGIEVDALRLIMEKDTTLVIDTNVPPFDLLKSDAVIPGAANSNAK